MLAKDNGESAISLLTAFMQPDSQLEQEKENVEGSKPHEDAAAIDLKNMPIKRVVDEGTRCADPSSSEPGKKMQKQTKKI